MKLNKGLHFDTNVKEYVTYVHCYIKDTPEDKLNNVFSILKDALIFISKTFWCIF